jgi:hypothetical protein
MYLLPVRTWDPVLLQCTVLYPVYVEIKSNIMLRYYCVPLYCRAILKTRSRPKSVVHYICCLAYLVRYGTTLYPACYASSCGSTISTYSKNTFSGDHYDCTVCTVLVHHQASSQPITPYSTRVEHSRGNNS